MLRYFSGFELRKRLRFAWNFYCSSPKTSLNHFILHKYFLFLHLLSLGKGKSQFTESSNVTYSIYTQKRKKL
jgi:hypothetical protein